MKKTLFLLISCGLGLHAQAATLFWQQTDISTPQSILEITSWNESADGSGTSKVPEAGDRLQFITGLGNILINDELSVGSVLLNATNNTNPVDLTIDFSTAGKITTSSEINFAEHWFKQPTSSITFGATLTPQATGTIGSRALLEAQGNYGMWNLIDIIGNPERETLLHGSFGTYNYKGIVRNSNWETISASMQEGDAYLVYVGENGVTPQKLEVRWKGAAPIPEPSTATLGLLALAGLCFRRKRNA